MTFLDRWFRLVGRRANDEVNEELTFHIEERVRENIASGMEPEAAREAARARFGDVKAVRAECTELLAAQRGAESRRDRLNVSWLDFKLGLRMLAKYPAVTFVGTIAIAFGIAVGAATFEVVKRFVHPSPPFGDERIVGIVNWYGLEAERRILHDFATWRGELRSVDDLGAFRSRQRNLVVRDGTAEPVRMSETNASAFRIAPLPPLLGRTLVADDERPSAERVAVISQDLWETRFGSSPDVVDSRIRLDGEVHTIVGVMPREFEMVSGEVWVPFRLNPLDVTREQSPPIFVFGRLAPGVSRREAQAELALLGRRAAAAFPETHARLEPEIVPFNESLLGVRIRGPMRMGAYSANLIAVFFLALVCANVSILVFARTAARESEMVVRSALGASRGRIVAQLFAEALVLGGLAAIVGLFVAAFGLRWTIAAISDELPGLSVVSGLSSTTVLYVFGLTFLGAAIVGVLPALKVTGRQADGRFRRAGASDSALGFGRVWTGVIVTQVALTLVGVMILAIFTVEADWIRDRDLGFAADEFLAARLEMEPEALSPADAAGEDDLESRMAVVYGELERRLLAEPEVLGVTHASRLPGEYHGRLWIEVEGGQALEWPNQPRLHTVEVGSGFFQTLDVPIVAGRVFDSGDVGDEARTVVVNQSFVEVFLGGANAIGRRVRYQNSADPYAQGSPDVEPGPWHEVVGVVGDLGTTMDPELPHYAALYHPVAPLAPVLRLAVRVRGDLEAFAPRLRALAASVDPALRVEAVEPLPELRARELRFYVTWLKLGFGAGGLLLLLCFAGLYAILSFNVSRRTREIGIRIALGAGRRRVVTAIVSRALVQLGGGIATGIAFIMLLNGGWPSSLQGNVMIAVAVTVMTTVGLLACLVPTRRALRIEPMEALRADG